MKLIKNANIYEDHQLYDILFDTTIQKIEPSPMQEKADEIWDIEGKLLLPGCIDAHVHFNDPGYNHHETFTTGTKAAAYGGITTIIDMPCTSIPPVTSVKNLKEKLEVIQTKAYIDFALWGGIRRNDFPLNADEINNFWKAGIVGFKIYTVSGMNSFAALSYQDIQSVLQAFPDLLFGFHAEDAHIINYSEQQLTASESMLPENYLRFRPITAEITAVKKIIEIADKNHIHFVHISSKEAAEFILKQKHNIDITFETCPHYLQFTATDFPKLKGKLKTAPPVKNEEDREFLRNILKTGKIDFITTDHAGCNWQNEKNLKDFSKVYNGIPGTQLMIPYLFSEFYLKEKTPLKKMIELTSENAAKRFGLFPQKGSMLIGTDADFTILDLQKPFTVNESALQCIGKYSPFHEEKFDCSVEMTFVRGNPVYNNLQGMLQEAGYGKWIKRK